MFNFKKIFSSLMTVLIFCMTLSINALASDLSQSNLGDLVFISNINKIGTLLNVNNVYGTVSVQLTQGNENQVFSLDKLHKITNCFQTKNSFCYFIQGPQIVVIDPQNQMYRISINPKDIKMFDSQNDPVESMFNSQNEQLLMESRSVLDTW